MHKRKPRHIWTQSIPYDHNSGEGQEEGEDTLKTHLRGAVPVEVLSALKKPSLNFGKMCRVGVEGRRKGVFLKEKKKQSLIQHVLIEHLLGARQF